MEVEYFKKYGNKELIIANMDEVSIYFDMGRNSTYHYKGDKSIKLIRNNGYRKRLTVCLAILSNGKKLPPFIIFKAKSVPTNPHSKCLLVRANANGWITEGMMKDWIQNVWENIKYENPENIKKLILIDKCSSHQKASVIDQLKKDSFVEFIPAGCTSLVQPLDLCINKPFKDELKRLYEKWLLDYGLTDKNKTKKGYIKAPSSILILKWVMIAWSAIDSDLIVKSFKYAGIQFNIPYLNL